jgi:hypothetical protein
MRVRKATSKDWDWIRDAHKRAGYGYELPGFLLGCHIIEEDGKPIAAAGYQPVAQIIAVLEPEMRSALKRLQAIQALHPPLAKEFLAGNFQSAFAFCDPDYRNFERRMMRMGWNKKLWPTVFLEREDIERAFGEKSKAATA